jgi:hypothetical protein
MNNRRSIYVVAMLMTAGSLFGQYRTGRVYNSDCRTNSSAACNELSVVPRPQLTPAFTWYDPEVYELPSGNLSFLAQSGNPSVNETLYYNSTNAMGISKEIYGRYAPSGIDTIYRAERSSSGTWSTPAFGAGPTLKGQRRRCDYIPKVTSPPPGNSQFTPNNIDPVGGHSIVRLQTSPGVYKYFMAFNGGNADYIVGKLYWAISDDGVNWTVYNWNPPAGYEWTPLVNPYYHDCNGGTQVTGFEEGVAEPFLAYVPNDLNGGPNGTFYLYFSYTHYTPDPPYYTSNPPSGAKTWYDFMAVRFGYNPSHPFGFGSNYQLFYDGVWRPHSGRLVFDYDRNSDESNKPLYSANDFYIGVFHSMTSIANSNPAGGGSGDLKRNPDTGQWLKITTAGESSYVTQTNSSLATNNWSTPQLVNTSTLTTLYTNTCAANGQTKTLLYGPALWYGNLGARRGWWLWAPVHATGYTGCFSGLGIVPMKLCDASEANCEL